MPLKFCPKCGGKLEEDAVFCSMCGEDLRSRFGTTQIEETDNIPSIQAQPPEPQPSSVSYSTQQQAPESYSKGIKTGTYATFFPRLVAWIIDIIIIAIIGAMVTISFWTMNINTYAIVFNLIDYAIGLLYFWLLESYNEGRTLGKVLLRLRTLDEETMQVATPITYLINNLAKPNLIFLILDCIIGLLVNSGDPSNKYRLTQSIAKTVVISE